LQFCLAGSGRTKIGAREVDVDPGLVVCSPAEAKFDLGRSFEQFALRIKRGAIEEDVTSLLGARPKQRLCFGDTQNCDAPKAKRLRDLVIATANNIDLSNEPIPQPLLREIAATIRLAVLYGVRSNLSDLLDECSKPAPPWQVARVEEWIDANWSEDVSIERLAALTGSGARSIFLAFKKARGYTPMAYLKSVRLKVARNMLLQPSSEISVTGVSFACNFMNPGHFARDYRREFGELPSATLQRTKALRS
jgi:AraC-like DNA-binding protein